MDLPVLDILHQGAHTISDLLCLASPTYRDVSEYVPPLISKSQRSPRVTSSTAAGPLGSQEGDVALTHSGVNVTL